MHDDDKAPPGRPGERLGEYRAKRSAERTAEPFGRPDPSQAGVFVVQKHAARRTHWDLRLEMNGVLKSWAVPRGPSADPAEKRLAVQTEDHPIDYQDFEGVIPDGNYGAGAMIVWDRGTWIPHEGDKVGLEKGKLLFELRGYKLRGVWTLFKTSRQKDGKEWMLVKKPDGWAREGEEAVYPEESVFSGLAVEELQEGGRRTEAIRRELASIGVPERLVDATAQRPMLAQVADGPFNDDDWIFELKYDGFRLLAAKVAGQTRLFYRRGKDATHLFPDLARALRGLPADSLILDGEVVVLDSESHPSFQLLQQRTQLTRAFDIRQAAVRLPASYFAFDLLAFEGHDLRDLPALERKRFLESLMPPAGPLRYCDHIASRGEDFYDAVEQMGLEGIVAKRADSTYSAGRSPHWLKIRVDRRDDLAIVGMTSPRGARAGFGALHLAYWDPNENDRAGGLVYAGRVGTGFSGAQIDQIYATLAAAEVEAASCTGSLPKGRDHVWVEPHLVCEVRYKECTREGLLRHPSFLGLRPDKHVEDTALHGRNLTASTLVVPEPPAAERPTLHLTNLDKVFWPTEGYTKGDLIDYYRTVAPAMLPWLEDRPLVLTRYPDGIDGKSFFQKNAPGHAPDWVKTESIWSEHSEREIEYFVCQSEDALAFIANLGAILLHVWSSRLDTLQQPDWCILDLDPKEAPFSDVVAVALAVRRLCNDIGMPTYVKTSGSTGLHVLLPLGRQCTYEQSRLLGELISRVVAAENPDIATITRVIERRGGKVYLDYVQNGHGRLLVAPFSVRPLPGATVSTPLRWSEVDGKLRMEDFDIRTVPARLRRMRKDPWQGLLAARPDLGAVLGALAERAG
jgi:bifunctional non-homologous end joining protein LigD